MSKLYLPTTNKAHSFETVNKQLIEAKRALQAQSRVLDLLAEINQDLLRDRAKLSKAVTDLKWKAVALKNSKKLTVVGLFNGIFGRRKEWQTAVQHDYELALSRYEKRQAKLALLESEHEALEQQLVSLADSQERYLAAHHQQQAFIIASYKGKAIDRFRTLSQRLQQTQAHGKKTKTALLAGKDAAIHLQDFIQLLENPLTWGEEMLVYPSDIWLAPLSPFAAQSVTVKLSACAKDIQEVLENFQQKLAAISWQFWPALSVTKPITRYSTLEELIRWWLYRSQQTKSRLNTKLSRLETIVQNMQKTVTELEAEQKRLIDAIWRKENFPQN